MIFHGCHFDIDATKKTLYMHHYNIQLRITTHPSVTTFSYLIQFVGPSVTRFCYLIQFVGQLLHNHKILWNVL